MKLGILIVLLFANLLCVSQVKNIDILLGKDERFVTAYLDSLFSLRTNPAYKIDKAVNEYGDVTLKCEYAIDDEEFYGCSNIMVTLQNFKGKVICVMQSVMGEYIDLTGTLSYLKANFKKVKAGWEKELTANYIIVATVEELDGFPGTYIIFYKTKANNNRL